MVRSSTAAAGAGSAKTLRPGARARARNTNNKHMCTRRCWGFVARAVGLDFSDDALEDLVGDAQELQGLLGQMADLEVGDGGITRAQFEASRQQPHADPDMEFLNTDPDAVAARRARARAGMAAAAASPRAFGVVPSIGENSTDGSDDDLLAPGVGDGSGIWTMHGRAGKTGLLKGAATDPSTSPALVARLAAEAARRNIPLSDVDCQMLGRTRKRADHNSPSVFLTAARAKAFEGVLAELYTGRLLETRSNEMPAGFIDSLSMCRVDKHMARTRSMTFGGSAMGAAAGAGAATGAADTSLPLSLLNSRNVLCTLVRTSPACRAAFVRNHTDRANVDCVDDFLNHFCALGEREYRRKIYDFLGMSGKRRMSTLITKLGIIVIDKRACYWGDLAGQFAAANLETTGWDDAFTAQLQYAGLTPAERERRQRAKTKLMDAAGKLSKKKKEQRNKLWLACVHGSEFKVTAVRKRPSGFEPLIYKNDLPRQARDKHRENSTKTVFFQYHRDQTPSEALTTEFTLTDGMRVRGSFAGAVWGYRAPKLTRGQTGIEHTEAEWEAVPAFITKLLHKVATDVLGVDGTAERPSYANYHPASMAGRYCLADVVKNYMTGRSGACHYFWIQVQVRHPGQEEFTQF